MNLKTAGARTLYDYWDGLRQGRLMPTVADFDLVEIAPILPNMMIHSATANDDFEFRFFGTKLVLVAGTDLTGQRVSDIMTPQDARETILRLRRVIEEPTILIRRFSVPAIEGGAYETENLLLPLGDETGIGLEVVTHAQRLSDQHDGKTFTVGAFGIQKLIAEEWHPLAQ